MEAGTWAKGTALALPLPGAADMSSPPGADEQCTPSRPLGPTSTIRKPLPGEEGETVMGSPRPPRPRSQLPQHQREGGRTPSN